MTGNQQYPGAKALQENPLEVINRLVSAINDHDVDALTACFADDYVNITPAHPARSFTGNDQVRRNWRSIFDAIPDVQARILRSAVQDRVVWTEWEHRGAHGHGAPHLMRGVVIFTVGTDAITEARFFLEPVDQSDQDATAALTHLLDR
ncbi:nuclear transport factor 2 family protein [Arthrobacter sp. 35/47]|uniref:nuclear transport factor 2 family protein n=1 Tax=Arthrobacter sp. 35/47 TaxID=269454 RepID=UPI00047D5FC6|nr:nuclear transport factor 2 family protein [Arthrobacter sp. 35/47]